MSLIYNNKIYNNLDALKTVLRSRRKPINTVRLSDLIKSHINLDEHQVFVMASENLFVKVGDYKIGVWKGLMTIMPLEADVFNLEAWLADHGFVNWCKDGHLVPMDVIYNVFEQLNWEV